MNTCELCTEEEILQVLKNSWHDNDETVLPPIFHGTDASLIGLTKAERDQLNAMCETIISFLIRLYEDNSINMSHMDNRLFESRDSYGSSATAYRIAKQRAEKSLLYNYGDFYVTNYPDRAIGYSQEAWIFGETGWTANRLIEGAKAVGLDYPDDETYRNAFQLFDILKQKSKTPVVLLIINGSSSELYTEGGTNIKDDCDSPEEFSGKIQSIKDSITLCASYRFDIHSLDENQEIYLIKQDNYNNLERAWKELSKLRK